MDSLALRLLVVLLLVLLTSHRSPEVTDVCCHAFTWALGGGDPNSGPYAYVAVSMCTEPSPQPLQGFASLLFCPLPLGLLSLQSTPLEPAPAFRLGLTSPQPFAVPWILSGSLPFV